MIKNLKVSEDFPKRKMKLLVGVTLAGVIAASSFVGIISDKNYQEQKDFKYISEMTQEEKDEVSSRIYLNEINHDQSGDFVVFITEDEEHGRESHGVIDTRRGFDYINIKPGEYKVFSGELESDLQDISIEDKDKDYVLNIDYSNGRTTLEEKEASITK